MRREIDSYGAAFADRCWVVVDDYLSATDKGGPIRTQVDELVSAGRLIQLGLSGWGNLGRPMVSWLTIFFHDSKTSTRGAYGW